MSTDSENIRTINFRVDVRVDVVQSLNSGARSHFLSLIPRNVILTQPPLAFKKA